MISGVVAPAQANDESGFMRKSRITATFSLALVLLSLGCRDEQASHSGVRDRVTKITDLPECRLPSDSPSDVDDVEIAAARAIVAIPRSARRAADGDSKWFTDSGTIAFVVHPVDDRSTERILVEVELSSTGWCRGFANGHRYLAQQWFGDAATGRGQYVQALWLLPDSQELAFVGMQPQSDSGRRLMGFVNRVRF